MLKSQKLAKDLITRYNILEEDAHYDISTMIENLVMSEINSYVTHKNMENLNKINERQVLPKQEVEGVKRVQVWPRR